MNTSFFGELLQTISERGRALLDRAPRPARRSIRPAPKAWSSCASICCPAAARPPAWRCAREILGRYARTDHRPAHRLFRGAGRSASAPIRRAWKRPSPPGSDKPGDATAADVHAASEPRRQELFRRLNLAPGGTAALVRMREQLMDVLGQPRRSRRGRRRFRPSVLVLVQPRLPGAAPHRLVDAGDRAGEDHPLRGGARDPATGTTCAGASIRPTGAATPSSIRRWWTTR